MNKRNKVFIGILTCSILTYLFSNYYINTKNATVKIKIDDVPSVVAESVESKAFDLKAYRNIVKKLPQESVYHQKIGKALYNFAMGDSFYSHDKLKILSMAKEHLLLAKNLKD